MSKDLSHLKLHSQFGPVFVTMINPIKLKMEMFIPPVDIYSVFALFHVTEWNRSRSTMTCRFSYSLHSCVVVLHLGNHKEMILRTGYIDFIPNLILYKESLHKISLACIKAS